MRLFYLIMLLLFAGAVIAFAVQNRDDMSLKFLDWVLTYPTHIILAVTYLLGMFSGWTVIGMLRRSLRRVTEREK